MSTALAIAAVTAVLRDVLNNGIIDHSLSTAVGNVQVTALAPDLIEGGEFDNAHINIFLYMVTPNPGYRNADLPAYTSDGVRLTNPPLALDLHYLITAYGSEDFHAEIVLGYAMQLLHERPILTRQAITAALTPPVDTSGGGLPPALVALSASDLADQVESIRLTHQVMSTEEISRLWSATQSHYRPTAAYLATVVLIESKQPVKPQTGVLQPQISAATISIISIGEVFAAGRPDRFLLPTADATIAGDNLYNANLRVEVDGTLLAPEAIDQANDNKVVFKLPALDAGKHYLRIVHLRAVGSPALLRPGAASPPVDFLLHPTVKERDDGAGGVEDDITVSNESGAGSARSATVTIKLDPQVQPGQQVQLELLQDGTLLKIVGATDLAAASDTFVFPVQNVAAGSYFVRVRVDTAETPFKLDSAGHAVGPVVAL